MKKHFSAPLYPYLLGLFFLVYKSSLFFPSFKIHIALLFLSAYIMAVFFLLKIGRRLKLPNNNDFTFLFSFLLLFTYKFTALNLVSVVSAVLFLLSLLTALLRIQFIPAAQKNLGLNIFLCMLTITTLVNGYSNYTKEEIYKQKSFTGLTSITSKKNIVWVLLDEYAASSCLKHQFNYNNPLDATLREKGFTVYDSLHSISDITVFSVNSLFNADNTFIPKSYISAVYSLKQSSWIQTLQRSGYSFVNLSFFDIYNTKLLDDLSSFSKTYDEQLLDGTVYKLISLKYNYPIERGDRYNQNVSTLLTQHLNEKTKQPKFIWAHFALPHAPYCRDSTGRFTPSQPVDTDSKEIKNRYVQYVAYANKLVENILTKIPDINNTNVIITGDHGARMPFLGNECRKKTFAAIHLPDSLNLTSKITRIQQIPFVLR